MAKIKAFKGIRYNPDKVNIADVVTQPYDKITPERQDAYYEKSEYNICRIILGKGEDKYDQAKSSFDSWLNSGILIQDPSPAIYPYFQEYTTQEAGNTITKQRRGFVILLQLEEFSSGVVLPHERTHSSPKVDRLNLLRTTAANFGQIFMLYPDEENKVMTLIEKEIADKPPLIDVLETYEKGVRHKLWRLDSQEVISEIIQEFESKFLLIADGHHRYETALDYMKENSAATYRMVTLVSMSDTGLLILPTHRALYGIDTSGFRDKLKEFFGVQEYENKEKLVSALQGKTNTLGLFDRAFWLLTLKDEALLDRFISSDRAYEYKTLDVTVLHSIVIEHVLGISKERVVRKENIAYLRDIDEGIAGVQSGKYDLFFIMNPTRMAQVRRVAQKHEVMPQKSTDFYPKVITGLVINKL